MWITTCCFKPCQNLLWKKPGSGSSPMYCSKECWYGENREKILAKAKAARVPLDISSKPTVCALRNCQNLLWRRGKTGPWPTYCSAAHAERRWRASRPEEINAARRAKYVPKRYERDCSVCGKPFVANYSRNVTCSKKCLESANPRRCSLDGCDRPHRAKGLCAVHWVAADRVANGRKKEPWNDRARHAYHSRRAQKIGSATEGPIHLTEIGDRDEWRCGICEELVSPALIYPDPASPSLDHIVPLSAGGAHVPGNVQVAHLRCNLQKGSRQ